jgi:hypothetical protein
MGIYGEHVLPRIVNVVGAMKSAEPLRDRVCTGLQGDVVEIDLARAGANSCPPVARYCVGDVGGECRDRALDLRGVGAR